MMEVRNVILVATCLASGLLAGCGASAPPAAAATPAPVPAGARIAWYTQCWAYFNEKKFSEFTGCYADDASSQQLGYGPPSSSGAVAVVAAAREFAGAFPDGRGDPLLVLVNDQRVASIQVMHGTNSGPIKGPDGNSLKPTHKPVGLWFGHLVETSVSGALQVRRELGIMDSNTLAAQLGWLKSPSRPVATAPVAAPLTVVASHNAVEAANLRANAALAAAWNRHDLAAVDANYTANYVQHVAAEADDFGNSERTASNIVNWAAFSDAHIATTTWAAGDYVVVEGVFTGTQDGEMPGLKLAPSQRKVAVPYLEIDRLVDGKIAEEWLFYDGAAFTRALAPAAASGK